MSRDICWICWCSYDDDGTCGCPESVGKTTLANEGTPENTHPLETAAAAELRRLQARVAQDEALLRRALEALDSDHPDIQLRTAVALRDRLEECAERGIP